MTIITERVIRATGKLDRSISELVVLSKLYLDDADWQTLKHHAIDMQAAANAILVRYAKRTKSS